MNWPSPVKTYHSDAYAAIDPSLHHLSTKGKNVVITGGGGSGLGPFIARAFATSGASSITILGRTEQTLLETKASLEKNFPHTKVFSIVTDIMSKPSVDAAFEFIKSNVGIVHVLVANAAVLPNMVPIAKSEADDWFNGFEVNVKGNYNLLKAFLPVAAVNAAVIDVNAAVAHLPYIPGFSSYHASKLASVKLFDYIHKEHPELFVLNVNPGILKTQMSLRFVGNDEQWEAFQFDSGDFDLLTRIFEETEWLMVNRSRTAVDIHRLGCQPRG
jgi:NAD(P)-dependent dehydrogenase (short-subunit alcohol dehydrogenase family)